MDDENHHSNREDSDDEENETLEESPCHRWLKRNERVDQCQVLGVDATFLAMDDEEGVEVVWSEIDFEPRDLPLIEAKEDAICDIFDHLVQLNHPNISKIHKFWIRKPDDCSDSSGSSAMQTSTTGSLAATSTSRPRICIITEYTSSGTLKHFLHKTKKQMKLEAWRKWCTQMLSALCYLHACLPQIVHGNLSCDTSFISYNGLIKIGALAPDAIHRTLRTHRNESKANLHFIAPECRTNNAGADLDGPGSDGTHSGSSSSGSSSSAANDLSCRNLSPAADVYSFGMCALQMAALEIATDEASGQITDESIQKTIDSLENSQQRDLIRQCLQSDPALRPTARELIFHSVIYEVPSLRLFCASSILNSCASYNLSQEQVNEEHIRKMIASPTDNGRVLADLRYNDEQKNSVMKQFKNSDFKKSDLDKFLEDVKNGGCPLTAVICTLRQPLISKARTLSPEMMNEEGRRMTTPDNPYDEETRRIVRVNCSMENVLLDSQNTKYIMKIIVKLDDKINRQLTCEFFNEEFDPAAVSQELVYYGFINKEDNVVVMEILSEVLKKLSEAGGATAINHERVVENNTKVTGELQLNSLITQPLSICASGPTQLTPSIANMITGSGLLTDTTQLQMQSLPALSIPGETTAIGHATSTPSLGPSAGVPATNVMIPQMPLVPGTVTGNPNASPQIYQELQASAPNPGYPQAGQIQLVHMVNPNAGQNSGPNVVYVSQPTVTDPSGATLLAQPQMVQFQPVQTQPVQTLQAGPPMQFVPAIQQNMSFAQPSPTPGMAELSSLYPVNSYVIPAQQPASVNQPAFQTQNSNIPVSPGQAAPSLQALYKSEPVSATGAYGNQC